jgi:hypothetical protein
MGRSVMMMMVGLVLMASVPAEALVLCKRRATVAIREKCKRKETTVSATDLGLVGPQGEKGDTGAAGADGADGIGIQAYAYVDKNGPGFVAAKTKNFTSLTRPSTGRYCLTPAAGIDPDAVPAVATVDHGRSAGADNLVQIEADRFSCGAGTFEVLTFASGVLGNDVSFVLLVP